MPLDSRERWWKSKLSAAGKVWRMILDSLLNEKLTTCNHLGSRCLLPVSSRVFPGLEAISMWSQSCGRSCTAPQGRLTPHLWPAPSLAAAVSVHAHKPHWQIGAFFKCFLQPGQNLVSCLCETKLPPHFPALWWLESIVTEQVSEVPFPAF